MKIKKERIKRSFYKNNLLNSAAGIAFGVIQARSFAFRKPNCRGHSPCRNSGKKLCF